MAKDYRELVDEFFDSQPNLWMRVDLDTVNPWNLPDWRDASQYPSPDDARYGCWHWEFLRRRMDYRAVWLDYQEKLVAWGRPPYRKQIAEGGRLEYKMEAGGPLTRNQREAARFRIDSLYSPACRYDLFLDSARGIPTLNSIAAPDRAADEICQVTPAFHGDMSAFCSRAAQKAQFLIAITPTFDLNAQWDYISAEIKRLNLEWNDGVVPREYEWAATNWQKYLRVLDARDNTSPHSNSWEGIAEVFRNERGTTTANKNGVRSWHRQALARLSPGTPFDGCSGWHLRRRP